MDEDDLPLMRHRVVVEDSERGDINCEYANLIAIEPGFGADENNVLINAIEWDTTIIEQESGDQIEVEDETPQTQIWFTGTSWNGEVKEGQYFYDRGLESGIAKLMKVRSTDYDGPIGWGKVLVEYIGRSQERVDVDALNEEWFEKFSHGLILLDEIKRKQVEG